MCFFPNNVRDLNSCLMETIVFFSVSIFSQQCVIHIAFFNLELQSCLTLFLSNPTVNVLKFQEPINDIMGHNILKICHILNGFCSDQSDGCWLVCWMGASGRSPALPLVCELAEGSVLNLFFTFVILYLISSFPHSTQNQRSF